MNETNTKSYQFLTGELVEVIATSLEEAEQKLADGDFTEIETQTELKFVGNA